VKKFLSFFLCALLLASSLLTMASCNLVQPGKLSEIAGTYILEEYTVTKEYDKDGNAIPEDEQKTEDKIEEYGIVEYYVITEGGYGYHIYKDNTTALYCSEVKQVYEYDSDDPALIREISFFDGDDSSSKFYIQARRHTMTDNTSAWQTNLKFGKTNIPIGEKATVTIRYKRVSQKQDLSYVSKKVGTTVTATPFLTAWLPDIMVGACSKSGDNYPYEEIYIYDYYVVDKTAMTATRYYAKTADGIQKTETVSFSYDNGANVLTVGSTVFSSYSNNNIFSFNNTSSEIIEGEVVNTYYTLGKASFALSALQESIEIAMDNYEMTQNPQE